MSAASKSVDIGKGAVAVSNGKANGKPLKKPVAKPVVDQRSDDDDDDDDSEDEEEEEDPVEDRKRTGKSYGSKHKKLVLEKIGNANESGIVKKLIDFEFSVSVHDLITSDTPKSVIAKIKNASEILKKTWIEGDQLRSSGDPTRGVLRSVTRVHRSSDAPFPIAYNINILSKNQLEKINMKSGRLVFKAETGLTVLDEIPANYQNHKADHAVLYSDNTEIQTGFLQLYSGLTKEELRKGTSIIKPPNTEDPTDENKALWEMWIIVKGEGANPVIPKILFENRKKLHRYNLDYKKLYNASQRNNGQIRIPYLLGEAMLESIAFGKGIKVAQDLVVNMTEAAVLLTHPQGGEPGVFGEGFKSYIQTHMSPTTLAAIKNEVFHINIRLLFVFWDPMLIRNSK